LIEQQESRHIQTKVESRHIQTEVISDNFNINGILESRHIKTDLKNINETKLCVVIAYTCCM